MFIKDYFLKYSKKIELALFLILVLFLPLSESVKQICIFCLIIFFIGNKIFERKLNTDFFSVGLMIFFATSLISIPFSANPYLGFKWSWNIFIYLFLYLCLINEFNSEKQINLIEKIFLVGLLLGLLWGIFVWKIFWAKPRLEIKSLGAPNATGTFLGLSILFLVNLFLLKSNKLFSNKKLLFFYLIIALLLIISIILNGSRGMYFGLLSSLLFLSYFLIKEKSKKLPLLFILIGIIIAISSGAIFYPELNIRFLSLDSLYDRFINWNKALQCFMINPLTGGGSKLCYDDPDNLFLAIVAKTGILGFLGFMILLYCYLKQFYNHPFLLAFLIFILSNGIFETSLKHESAIAFVIYVFLVSHESFNN